MGIAISGPKGFTPPLSLHFLVVLTHVGLCGRLLNRLQGMFSSISQDYKSTDQGIEHDTSFYGQSNKQVHYNLLRYGFHFTTSTSIHLVRYTLQNIVIWFEIKRKFSIQLDYW